MKFPDHFHSLTNNIFQFKFRLLLSGLLNHTIESDIKVLNHILLTFASDHSEQVNFIWQKNPIFLNYYKCVYFSQFRELCTSQFLSSTNHQMKYKKRTFTCNLKASNIHFKIDKTIWQMYLHVYTTIHALCTNCCSDHHVPGISGDYHESTTCHVFHQILCTYWHWKILTTIYSGKCKKRDVPSVCPRSRVVSPRIPFAQILFRPHLLIVLLKMK